VPEEHGFALLLPMGKILKSTAESKIRSAKPPFASSGAVSELIEVRDEVCDALVASSVGLEIDTRSD
jgi:hypothetical protein